MLQAIGLERQDSWDTWRRVTLPADPSELTFLGTDMRTPYLAAYTGAHAYKVAYYMLRWESTRGDPGPWRETVSATIGA